MLIFGVTRVREFGRDTSTAHPRSIVSNHVSPLDILYFMHALPSAFVAKLSVSQVPFIGSAAKGLGCVFVDRSQDDHRRSAFASIKGYQTKDDKSLPTLVIFPEGTTTNGRGVIPLKRGAFASMTAVTPVVLIYSSGTFHPAMELMHPLHWLALTLATFPNTSLDAHWLPSVAPEPTASEASFVSDVWRSMTTVLSQHNSSWDSGDVGACWSWDGKMRRKAECKQILLKHLISEGHTKKCKE